MGFTVFDAGDLPAEHRFEWWRDMVSKGAGPTRVTADHPADFRVSMGLLPLDDVRIARMSFPAMSSERTGRLIRRSDPETYELTLLLTGSLQVSQAGREAALSAGDFNLWSSSTPSHSRAQVGGPGTAPSDAIVLHLPRSLVALPESRVDGLLARGLVSDRGVGAVLARHLTSVVQEAEHLSEADGRRIGVMTADLATAFLAHHINAADTLPPPARHRMLLGRIDAFIDDNLAARDLSPQVVAARHHISVRLLHRLFADRGETVSATIRRRRLERCSADLVDPRLAGLPVHAVGARWGFSDPASFSRSFRAAYDRTPRDHRHAHGGPAKPHATPRQQRRAAAGGVKERAGDHQPPELLGGDRHEYARTWGNVYTGNFSHYMDRSRDNGRTWDGILNHLVNWSNWCAGSGMFVRVESVGATDG
ncbi:helix-turn-helix domain-containing protein [Streptomyces sp. NPDC059193]|uniref:AraC-like ligand-binding domain-containing protein n=1 Tax=Streptomyces sp. NPDC059193 TaxID=3346763 RepID=UPI003676EBCB